MPSCFFIGHRDAPESLLPTVRSAVERLIRKEGVTDFYVGSRGSFDRLASSAVLGLRATYPDLRLYRVLAYHPAERDAALPEGFSGTVYPEGLERVPRRYAILRANRAMADHCQYLVAYAPHETGNARRVLDYARRREKKGLIRCVELQDNK